MCYSEVFWLLEKTERLEINYYLTVCENKLGNNKNSFDLYVLTITKNPSLKKEIGKIPYYDYLFFKILKIKIAVSTEFISINVPFTLAVGRFKLVLT